MRLGLVFFSLFLAVGLVFVMARPSKDSGVIEKAKMAIREKLKDPDSAQFRNVRISVGDVKAVIGEVNTKNSYGGYIGYQKFYVDFSRPEIALENEVIRVVEESIAVLRRADMALGGRSSPVREDPKESKLYLRLFVEGW